MLENFRANVLKQGTEAGVQNLLSVTNEKEYKVELYRPGLLHAAQGLQGGPTVVKSYLKDYRILRMPLGP